LFTGDQTKVIKDPLNDRRVERKEREKKGGEKGETERKDTEGSHAARTTRSAK
jgi:hypothetical protein